MPVIQRLFFINRNVLTGHHPDSNGIHSITTSLQHFKQQKLTFPSLRTLNFKFFSVAFSSCLSFFSEKKEKITGTINPYIYFL